MRPMPKSVKSAAKPESRTRRDKRNRIVDAAISVFAESGFHRARVSDIAAEAGIAYGLGCHYFKNKEEILNTIFEERWTGFLEAVENIADSPGSTEKTGRDHCNDPRRIPGQPGVGEGPCTRNPALVPVFGTRSDSRDWAAVARVLRDGQAKGEVRGDLDPDIACYIVVGGLEIVVSGLVLNVIEIDSSQAETEYYSNVAATVVEIFLRGLAADIRDQ